MGCVHQSTACQKNAALNGLWQDSAQAPFSNCYVSYHIDKGDLTMIHFFHYQGKPFFEKGQGTFKAGVLKYHVEVLQGIDDWPRKGYHQLSLSEDGQILEGFYVDATGRRGELQFHKRQ